MTTSGLHHVTGIAGAAQQNLDFYTRVLGLRLVKKTVNFDDPGTYHFYFGDATGTPGTILTFFPWANAAPGKTGAGMTAATAFSVPAGSLDWWMVRLSDHGVETGTHVERFDEAALAFRDPDGLRLELVAHPGVPPATDYATDVAAEHRIRGFHSVALNSLRPEATARVLTELLGFDEAGEEGGRRRFRVPGGAPATVVDLVDGTSTLPGRMAKGTIHHVAFRARDDAEQADWREAVQRFGLEVTPVQDRQYFHSIYFREPGGILFEIATDEPGFLWDEDRDHLGTALKLPPWFEDDRARIERRLPEVTP